MGFKRSSEKFIKNLSSQLNVVQRLHRIQIIWVRPEFFQFYITDICQISESIAKSVNLESERPGKPCSSSWSLRKCIAYRQTLPYWKFNFLDSIQILQLCKIWHACMLERIRTFVAKLDMSRIRAFWYFFHSDLAQTNAIWLRLYSDIWSKKWWLEPLLSAWSGAESKGQCHISPYFCPKSACL